MEILEPTDDQSKLMRDNIEEQYVVWCAHPPATAAALVRYSRAFDNCKSNNDQKLMMLLTLMESAQRNYVFFGVIATPIIAAFAHAPVGQDFLPVIYWRLRQQTCRPAHQRRRVGNTQHAGKAFSKRKAMRCFSK